MEVIFWQKMEQTEEAEGQKLEKSLHLCTKKYKMENLLSLWNHQQQS